MIEAQIDEQTIKKPYSIASTNLMLQNEKLIWFVVKKASESGMSDFLTTKLQIWDTITLKWAIGHYIDPQEYKNYLFVSIGSWLSPNLWIFQHLVYESHAYERIANIVGERTIQELVPYIQDRFTNHGLNNIKNYFCLSQEEVDKEDYYLWYVQSQLTEAVSYTSTQVTCFVCWAPTIVTDVVTQLIRLWIPQEQIVIEKY